MVTAMFVRQGNNQAAADQNSATSFVSIAVVDVRNNKPRKMNSGTRKTVLPVNCRGKRQGGGVGLAAGRSGREAVSNVSNCPAKESTMW